MKTITTAIGHLGDSDVLNQDVVAKVEEYMSAMYMECTISAVSVMPDFIFSESSMPLKQNQTH